MLNLFLIEKIINYFVWILYFILYFIDCSGQFFCFVSKVFPSQESFKEIGNVLFNINDNVKVSVVILVKMGSIAVIRTCHIMAFKCRMSCRLDFKNRNPMLQQVRHQNNFTGNKHVTIDFTVNFSYCTILAATLINKKKFPF